MTIYSGPQSINDYPVTLEQTVGAAANEAFERSPLASIVGAFSQKLRGSDVVLTQAEALERVGLLGLQIPAAGIREGELNELILRKEDEHKRRAAMDRASGVLGVSATIAGSVLGAFADPVNVASAFIPTNAARLASGLANARTRSAAAMVGAREGAISAGISTAMFEPIILGQASNEQADYTMADSVLNIAFGSAFGGGLHAVGSALVHGVRKFDDLRVTPTTHGVTPSLLEAMPQEGRERFLRSAFADTLQDFKVRAEDIFGLHPEALARVDAFVAAQKKVDSEAKISAAQKKLADLVEPEARRDSPFEGAISAARTKFESKLAPDERPVPPDFVPVSDIEVSRVLRQFIAEKETKVAGGVQEYLRSIKQDEPRVPGREAKELAREAYDADVAALKAAKVRLEEIRVAQSELQAALGARTTAAPPPPEPFGPRATSANRLGVLGEAASIIDRTAYQANFDRMKAELFARQTDPEAKAKAHFLYGNYEPKPEARKAAEQTMKETDLDSTLAARQAELKEVETEARGVEAATGVKIGDPTEEMEAITEELSVLQKIGGAFRAFCVNG